MKLTTILTRDNGSTICRTGKAKRSGKTEHTIREIFSTDKSTARAIIDFQMAPPMKGISRATPSRERERSVCPTDNIGAPLRREKCMEEEFSSGRMALFMRDSIRTIASTAEGGTFLLKANLTKEIG